MTVKNEINADSPGATEPVTEAVDPWAAPSADATEVIAGASAPDTVQAAPDGPPTALDVKPVEAAEPAAPVEPVAPSAGVPGGAPPPGPFPPAPPVPPPAAPGAKGRFSKSPKLVLIAAVLVTAIASSGITAGVMTAIDGDSSPAATTQQDGTGQGGPGLRGGGGGMPGGGGMRGGGGMPGDTQQGAGDTGTEQGTGGTGTEQGAGGTGTAPGSGDSSTQQGTATQPGAGT